MNKKNRQKLVIQKADARLKRDMLIADMVLLSYSRKVKPVE